MATEINPRVVPCRGSSSFEIGHCHGIAAKSQIHSSIENYREFFFSTTHLKWDAIQKVAQEYLPAILENPYSKHLVEEMKGIAEGAAVGFSDILALNVRSEIALAVAPRAAPPDACSAFTLTSSEEESDSKTRWLAQNWDWKGSQLKNMILLDIEYPKGCHLLTITEAGIVGKIGFNQYGAGVTLNAIRASGTDRTKLPIHLLLRLVLESTSVEEALNVVKSSGGAGSSGHLLVCDEDTAVGVEVSPYGYGLLQPGDTSSLATQETRERSLITHTNHWISKPPPAGFEEIPWLVDTTSRNERVHELASSLKETLVEEDVVAVLKDTENGCGAISRPVDPSAVGTPWEGMTTVFGIVMNLSKRTALIIFGQPSEGGNEELRLSL
ncbi:hypothetical protein PVAG01_03476 [Phlyctema vagabunda]|uniref:Peptidase C45 hydrolase domain-containing protein n=1 Tax=Phlyctema vagabunda TaxID=108571 RepID=A0ABR4PLI3_9HELO